MADQVPPLDPQQLLLIEAIHLPLALLDMGSSLIVYVNGPLETLLAQDRSKLIGKPFVDCFTASSRSRADALIRLFSEIREAPMLKESGLEILRASHRPVLVDVSASEVRSNENSFVIISLHDLTSLDKAHQDRERSLKELARVSKLADIGVLAAGVAHELNNPLMIIHGYAENIDLLLAKKNWPRHELRVQIGEILKASERMGRVISQMTRMARHDEGHFVVADLNEIASEVVRFLGFDFRQNGIEVEMEFSEPLLIQCDAGQIEQIIMNVLSNAKHALKNNPDLKQIKIAGWNTAKGVLLEISNNGPEIPEHIRERLMTPFFTTKNVGEGSGLGLAISYGIMKAHGGDMSFSSNPSQTTFSLRFPATEKEIAKPMPDNKMAIDILIVDDEHATLEILSLKLKSFGFNVYKAAHAMDALEILRVKPSIKAMFTDIRMPEVDGIGLIRTVHQLMKPMPMVFVLTGYALSPSSEKELHELGISGLLTKPLNHAAFSQAISQIRQAVLKMAA